MASSTAQLALDNIRSILMGTSDHALTWKAAFLLIRFMISCSSPTSFSLYINSQNHDKGKNNDSGKTVASNTADSNNENLQTKGKTDSSHDETQVPTYPIVATSPITSNPFMMSVPIGKKCAINLSERPNPVEYLTYFNCGHVIKLQNGTTITDTDRSKRIRPLARSSAAFSTQTALGDSLSR